MYKDLASSVARNQEFYQRSCVFQKLPFRTGIFFYKSNVAKLVVDNEVIAIRRCSSKQMFLKISQISEKTSVLESLLIKLVCSFIKKRLQHRCFPVKLADFFRTAFFPFFTESVQWLLLIMLSVRKLLHFTSFTLLFFAKM